MDDKPRFFMPQVSPDQDPGAWTEDGVPCDSITLVVTHDDMSITHESREAETAAVVAAPLMFAPLWVIGILTRKVASTYSGDERTTAILELAEAVSEFAQSYLKDGHPPRH